MADRRGAYKQRCLLGAVDNDADPPSLLFLAATTKRMPSMSVASTLLEQTEGLQGRLDQANGKHLAKTDPHSHNRKNGLRAGAETAIGGITFGAATTILTRQRQVAEHKFQSPFALDLRIRHDQPLPASYGATLRAVDRTAARATHALPSLIESIVPRLTDAQANDARQAAVRARIAGDITTTIDMIWFIQQVSAR